MCPAGCRPLRNRSSTALRVGSAKAPKVASGEYVTERFRIMRNSTVTNKNLSRGFFDLERKPRYFDGLFFLRPAFDDGKDAREPCPLLTSSRNARWILVSSLSSGWNVAA